MKIAELIEYAYYDNCNPPSYIERLQIEAETRSGVLAGKRFIQRADASDEEVQIFEELAERYNFILTPWKQNSLGLNSRIRYLYQGKQNEAGNDI